MNPYVFMTDSDSDLPFSYVDELDLSMVYMPYIINGKEFMDDLGRSGSQKEYFDNMRAGAAPSTSLLPMGACDTNAVYEYEKDVTLRLYALKDTAACDVRDNRGKTAFSACAKRSGNNVHFSVHGKAEGLKVLLVGVHKVNGLTGATAEDTPEGLLLTPEGNEWTYTL